METPSDEHNAKDAHQRGSDGGSSSATAAQQHTTECRATVCKQLIRSRLQQIEMMEEKLQQISKYSLKLLNTHDDLAFMLAREKQDAIELAATISGARASEHDYVRSYSAALEQCCNVLLER